MNETQRQQAIEFLPNFLGLLREAGFTRAQATEAAHSALACLFAAVWKIPTSIKLTEEEQGFLLALQVTSLNMVYGMERRAVG